MDEEYNFSLDIIFISENNIIVDVYREALPLSEEIYTSEVKTKYILEIKSGLIQKLGIDIGDEVHIEYNRKNLIKIRIQVKNKFYIGPGKILLLEKIGDKGSISKAAENSYHIKLGS